MKFYKDNFDTEILKRDVYKFFFNTNITERKFRSFIKDFKKGLIFCFTIFSNQNINLLKKYGFDFISIRNTYKLNLDLYRQRSLKVLPKRYKIINREDAIKIIRESNLIQLAKTIYKTNRYAQDPLINKHTGVYIYINWIKNSLYKGYANEAFLAFDGLVAGGLITVKIKNNQGFIDLLGIIKSYQNKKLGSHLLKKAIDYMVEKGINDIFVITNGENIPANIFYQKNHFIIYDMKLVYHKHIKDGEI